MNDPPRVLIADDHQPIRAAVREALELDNCQVVAEAVTAYDAVRLAQRLEPDVCILDITMPGGGLWALREIHDRLPNTRCLMLTVSDSSSDLFDALRSGACGYLLKDIRPAEIPRAVRAAMAGDAVLSGDLTARVVTELQRSHPWDRPVTNVEGRQVTFTHREWEVLELMLEDVGTTEIAKRLFLRPVTVRRHVSTAMHKLRVSSRQEALTLLRAQQDGPRPRRSD